MQYLKWWQILLLEKGEEDIDGHGLYCLKSLPSGKSLLLLNDRMVPLINKYPLDNILGIFRQILKDFLSNQT